jgi:hypothetical protein
MDSSAVAAAAGVATALIALVAAVLVVWQVVEMRKTTYASAFKAVYDMLQDESLRQNRRFVMRHLRIREFVSWSDEDIQRAERVCHSYDCVGIMCRSGFIPTDVVADSWGDSLRTCWNVVQPSWRSTVRIATHRNCGTTSSGSPGAPWRSGARYPPAADEAAAGGSVLRAQGMTTGSVSGGGSSAQR